jgi:hypothetical protein
VSLYATPPTWRYRIRLTAGGEVLVDPRDCRRVIDKRNDAAAPQTVWEVAVDGVVHRLWPEDIAGIEQEAVG